MSKRTCATCATCVTCPNCGEQIDFHAGHINNGRVFVCEKGKPLMREVRYHCRHCDSTIIFLKKCEPKGSAMTEYEPAGAKRRLFTLIEQASEEHQ